MKVKIFKEYPAIRNRIAEEILFKRAIIREVYTHEFPYQRRFRVAQFRDAYVQGIITGLYSRKEPTQKLATPLRSPVIPRKKRVKRTLKQQIFGDLA